ncbi:uncharacterized protein K452DRAFT_45192 [Aplosporella prunicola CBS 121167]|uniref:Uncharacterized protein n=1 Tax=Aplosporella prunicola CBS 121167 TaxID=1176127 RepID=A0A6A6BCT5_9PEZI|nr:uncharacterized protein K452DRAFT_45192 [Aplosporella prunicola CBS 121167]KAF2141095.1 hypothetical protein K452DRAFT_45192 [Aplosporella prunicola CBS 121167]
MTNFTTLLPRHISYTFTYQSQDINFGEWTTLITLCLAPVLTHILIGAPEQIIIARPGPSWLDSISHYNPISIFWRYYAITDRRIRTTNWNADDMVAANSAVWSESGWYSPQMLDKRALNGTYGQFPRKNRISLISTSAFKTLIITLQGVQSMYYIRPFPGWKLYSRSFATIFGALAMMGFLRLSAAPWLLDDSASLQPAYSVYNAYPSTLNLMSEDDSVAEDDPMSRRLPRRSSRGIIVRVYFLWLAAVVLGLAISNYVLTYKGPDIYMSATFLAETIFFCFLLGTGTFIAGYYIITDRSDSTILPCFNSLWYKYYTVVLYAMAISFIVVSALETRKTPEGAYVDYPPGRNGAD